MQTKTLESTEQVATMAEPVEAPSERTESPSTLAGYAKCILELHHNVETANRLSQTRGREAIAAAIKAGQYLAEVKEQVGHGNWLPWLEQNCKGISDTTAQRYMKLANNSHVNYLKECTSLRQAYICTGAIKPTHIDKNPEDEPEPAQGAGDVQQAPGETPQIILGQMERGFAGFQSLYKTLVKASPDLEATLFDTCDPSLMPLPIVLNRLRYAANDALAYFGLPEVHVVCIGCGRIREADDTFGAIFPNTPEYMDRQEWCEECVAYYGLWVRRCEGCGAELFYGMEGDTAICLPPYYAKQYGSPDCGPTLKKRGDKYFLRFPDNEAITRYVNERHMKCSQCIPGAPSAALNIAQESRLLIEDLKALKGLSVKQYTLAQKLYQLQKISLKPSIVASAEENVWTPADLENEQDTITAIQRLCPKIVIVKDKAAHLLWTVYRHYVSSAVNNGATGRNIKFLVVDAGQSANPVLGIGAISGDFPSLAPRDEFIGWTREQRDEGKLTHTAVASTIVATQPFGFNFNGGKLIAALTTSQPIRDEWRSRYGDVLVGMTTTSLFGVPSMYDRIDQWKRMGETTGKMPIQPKLNIYHRWLEIVKGLAGSSFQKLITQDADTSGPVTNYKAKVLTLIYRTAGVNVADFQHGHRRGIYFSEFYENTRDFLCGRVLENDLIMKPLFQETVQQITDRWRVKAIKRYQTLKAAGKLKPQKHSYRQLGKMDFQTAQEAFLDDVGR
jgi:hypothetical protein